MIDNRDITFGTKNAVSHMIGRDNDIQTIIKILEMNYKTKHKTALWIYSMGGIGKTQLCRKLYSVLASKFSYVGWVSCNGNFKTSLVNSLLNKYSSDSLDDAFKKSIDYINSLGRDLILFIDNFDSMDKSIKDIEMFKCNVIITSRNKNPDTFNGYELGFLPFKECKKLFKKFYKLEDNLFMNEIIHKTGYLTLAIELIAKTGQKTGLSLEKLYFKLEEKGFDIQTVVTSNWDNNGEKLNAEMARHFSIVFDLSCFKENENALYILSNMALFPYLSISQNKIVSWLSLNEENNLLFDLYESGWLQYSEYEYVMHPVISYSVLKNNPPSFCDSRNLIIALAEEIKINTTDNFIESLTYLPFADSVGCFFKDLEYINCESADDISLLCIRIASIYRHNGEYKKSLEWANFSAKCWNYSLKENGVLANVVFNTLAEIHLDMRNSNDESKKWALLAINEDIIHSDVDDFMKSTSHHNLACVYIQTGEYSKALKEQLKAISLRENNNNSHQDRIHLANTYRNLAMIYRHLKRLNDAYTYQRKALDIFEEVYSENKNHPDLPVAYSVYSFILRDMGKINEAIKYQSIATSIRETINDKDPKLGINYNNLGMFNRNAGNLLKAKLWLEKAINFDLKFREENHPDLAWDYFNYALILLDLNEINSAIKFLLKSKEIEKHNKNFENIKEIDALLAQYRQSKKA